MKITVAIITRNGGEKFQDCMHAICNQRVIKADNIKVYDYESTDQTIDTARNYGATVIEKKLVPNFSTNNLDIVRSVLLDNRNTDILILLSQDTEVDPSAISELFRHFLTNDKLAVVNGRQMALFENNLLSRYTHNYFYPISNKNYPIRHIMRTFSSFSMVAYRVKYIFQEYDIIPDIPLDLFGDLAISAKVKEKGFQTMYNPLAMCKTNRNITLKHVFYFSKHLNHFLNNNPWFANKWQMDRKDPELFFSGFKEYISNNSSIPFASSYALLCFIAYKVGELFANFESKNISNDY